MMPSELRDAVVDAATTHRFANKMLDEHMRAGRGITFDHPLWQAMDETRVTLFTAVDAFHAHELAEHAAKGGGK